MKVYAQCEAIRMNQYLNEINTIMWETVMIGRPLDRDGIMKILTEWCEKECQTEIVEDEG